MVGTATSTGRSPIVSITSTFAALTPTNDTAARGRRSVRVFYYGILCVNSARVTADSLPQKKCITSCRWQTAVRMTRATSWLYVRAAIQKLRSAVLTRVRIHTRNDPVGAFLPLCPFQLDNAVGSRVNFRESFQGNSPISFSGGNAHGKTRPSGRTRR